MEEQTQTPLTGSQFPSLPGMASDMKFVGIMSIVYGAFSCLNCIGAIWGIPIIFAGIRLREAAEKFDEFLRTNTADHLESAFERQGRCFFIVKVLLIISIAFTLLVIIGVALMIFGSLALSDFG
ncbi:DUF5362 domain-containing protein [candidate division KSB1 bacterium]